MAGDSADATVDRHVTSDTGVTAMTPHSSLLMRELHHRSSDGIDVRLLWSKDEGRVAVAVSDAKTGEAFTLEVRASERPIDVFHHPFAYAASRGRRTHLVVDPALAR
jgi:hypothetical protein